MSGQFFEGAAGTGKTYNLIMSLECLVVPHDHSSHQKVLALTFMHGSRARLDNSLSELKGLHKRFGNIAPDKNEYEQLCYEAAKLLEKEVVRQWVSLTYPIVLVDEAQDLSHARLAMMKELASSSTLLAAADEYQHLDEINSGNVSVKWLSDSLNVTRLQKIERTNDQGLLQVAHNLRNGEAIIPLLKDGYRGQKELGSFVLLNAPTWQMLAWHAGFALRSGGESQAILTLSSNDANANNAINRLTQETQNLNRKRGTTFGPFSNVKQERKTEVVVQECLSSIGYPTGNLSISGAVERCAVIEDRNIRESVCGKIARRKKISGQIEVSNEEIEAIVKKAYQNTPIAI